MNARSRATRGFLLAAVTTWACDTSDATDQADQVASRQFLQPDVRIDAYENDLVPIGWMGISPNGTLAIIQQQDFAVRFFDAAGAPTGSFGAEGDGPNEFRRPLRAGWIADTLWVSDTQLRRVTLIAPDLANVGTFVIASAHPKPQDTNSLPTFPFPSPYAMYHRDTLLLSGIGMLGDPLAEALDGPLLVMTDATGQIERSVWQRPPSNPTISFTLSSGAASSAIPPFYSSPRWIVSPSADRIVTLVTSDSGPDANTLQVVGLDARTGERLFSRRVPFSPDTIPPAMIDSAIAFRIERAERASRPELRDAIRGQARDLIPRIFSPVAGMFVGNDDRVWIGLRPTEEGAPWIVLGRDGEPETNVFVPPNVGLRAANSTHAWGVEFDAVDVASPVRFPLP